MKNLIVCAFLILLLPIAGEAQLNLTTSDPFTITGTCLDSAGFYVGSDSVRIVVYHNGVEVCDAWFNDTDPQCIALNGMLVFTDSLGSIDNDAGEGLYEVMAGFYLEAGDLYFWKSLWIYSGIDLAELAAVHDSLKSQDDWVLRPQVPGRTLAVSEGGRAGLDLDNTSGYYHFSDFGTGILMPGTFHSAWWSALRDSSYSATVQVLEDSTHKYQGEAADLDSSSIANAVWNAPAVNHAVDGTFGSYLDTEVSGLQGGSGAYAVSLMAFDSSSNATLPGTGMAIRNPDQTALIASGRTGLDGLTACNLDGGSYAVVATCPGIVFSGEYLLNVSGVQTDTVFGYRFDPGTPADPLLCRVYGHVYDLSGQPLAGISATATLPDGAARTGTVIVSPFHVSSVTDSSGYFSLDLVPSDQLIPTGTFYEFSVTRSDGTVLRRQVKVPDQTTWQLGW